MIEQSLKSSHETPEKLMLPFIRLKVDYSDGYAVLKSRTLNSQFEGKLANVKDFI